MTHSGHTARLLVTAGGVGGWLVQTCSSFTYSSDIYQNADAAVSYLDGNIRLVCSRRTPSSRV